MTVAQGPAGDDAPPRSPVGSDAIGSEAPLPSPQSTAASLAPERPPSSGPVAARAQAVRVERSRAVTARRSVLGGVDRELPPVNLAVVEEPDRLGCLGLTAELDEREPPRPAGLAIGGQVDLDDRASRGQELRQGVRRGPELQVPYKDAGWNG